MFSVSPMNYVAVSTLLMFSFCETRQCTDIAIMNDVLIEDKVSFSVSLMRTSELDTRITLDPTDGKIVIDKGLLYYRLCHIFTHTKSS